MSPTPATGALGAAAAFWAAPHGEELLTASMGHVCAKQAIVVLMMAVATSPSLGSKPRWSL